MRLTISTTEMRNAIAIGLGYFALASTTIAVSRFDGGLAEVWIATSLLTAHLLTLPPRRWVAPVIASGIGSVAATTLFGFGAAAAVPIGIANLSESLLGAMLLTRTKRHDRYFDSMTNLAIFALLLGLIAPLVSGLGGALVAASMTGRPFGMMLRDWVAGHGLGALVFAPLMSLLINGDAAAWARRMTPWRRLESVALTLLMLGATVLVFGQVHYPLLFLPMLPLMVIAFRLEQTGTALAVVILALAASLLTAIGLGPINMLPGTAKIHAVFLQAYLAVTALTILPVAAELKQRRDVMRRLRESEARYRLITESATDIVIEIDRHGVLRYVSPSVREITGFLPQELVGQRATRLISGPDARTFFAALRKVRNNPGAATAIEYRARDASGTLKWFEANTRGLFDDDGELIASVSAVRDITHRKSLEMQLAHAAATDPLTGLANRRAFDALLDRKIADHAGTPLAGCVAIFDLDFFKRVNDQHGHAVGDLVLQAFARSAQRVVRSNDFVARLGGEEFGIILDGADTRQAEQVCDRLRQLMASQVMRAPDGSPLRVTASAGIALIDRTSSRATIMRAADDALYAAKSAGRDRLSIAA